MMKKKKKHILAKLFLFVFCLFIVGVVALAFGFIGVTKSAKLSVEALTENYSKGLFSIETRDGTSVDTSSLFPNTPVEIEQVPEFVKNAFIATEDKRFYSHKGIDFLRIGSATIKNIKNRGFKEGASTITQQLIKNTHLTREKTLTRKAKEIKLSLELERKFSKDEILEMYLNNIYFGSGAYGIEKAAKLYFSKSVENLSLPEGAMLAGIINAPSYYDPISHPDRALKRRNVVLLCMQQNGYITKDEYSKNANLPLNIVKSASKTQNMPVKLILSEAAKALNVTENQIKNMKIKIVTSLDDGLQNMLLKEASDENIPSLKDNSKPAIGTMIIDNNSKNIVAIYGNSRYNLLSLRRQPGSTIKPIIAYAPALEKGIIYTDSIIVDEEINIDGYSPSNFNNKYAGAVSAREALEKSLNIPAVKILSKVGVSEGKSYAKNMGLTFDSQDNYLALALGGMTKGLTLQEIADAYSCFATNGRFSRSGLIEKIVSDGKVIYSPAGVEKQAITPQTAYLITDMLKGTAVHGTARRLSSLKIPVAAKTGTVGASQGNKNTDAYSVCYTTDYTIITWIGAVGDEKLDSSINGASYPTIINKNILSKIYSSRLPEDFEKPEKVETMFIDTRRLSENKLELASEFTPIEYKRPSLFNTDHLPKVSESIAEKVNLEVRMESGQKPTFMFESKRGADYVLYRSALGEENYEALKEFSGKDGSKVEFTDEGVNEGLFEYYVLTKMGSNQAESNHIRLKVS